ncbi:metallophosphoesterase [Tistrella bauzanensis]|uniref:Metallophosphoesterase n=1 Tax=Tistrella bauzanensis TaxID=657419 RepID=A0ABQ1IAI0_9PROT|nr:TIGR00282 family metallophosphoesterase [Tistrella bauzanensis]GGB28875.1 metallophosphoesterase [Tistrella bauzanensis]
MRILFLGDVVGRTGRQAVIDHATTIRAALGVDLLIVNGENAASGFGITPKICESFYAAGVDILTTGNHVWDQREIQGWVDQDQRLLRPLNFPPGTPGRGATMATLPDGRRVVVANVMCSLFMETLDDPFRALAPVLRDYPLGGIVSAIFVDLHGEATSEKMAYGHYLDGQVTAVIGTHTHVPTADHQVLPGGTAFQCDAGMCGDYDSVIGMDKAASLDRFTRKMRGQKLLPANGPATICGSLIETDDATGLARSISPLRVGGRLSPAWPGAEPMPESLMNLHLTGAAADAVG